MNITEYGDETKNIKECKIDERMVKDLHQLSEECKITRFPDYIYYNCELWVHNVLYKNNSLIGAASSQVLKYCLFDYNDKASLVCSVMIKQEYQKKGYGRYILTELQNRMKTERAFLLVEKNINDSSSFFKKIGWIPLEHIVQVVQWN